MITPPSLSKRSNVATSSTKLDKLGRLEEVKDLRSIWPDEARDFTPWLSQLANVAILEDALGISLEVQGIEKEVGPYVTVHGGQLGTRTR